MSGIPNLDQKGMPNPLVVTFEALAQTQLGKMW
jgi:hypothetical protein